MPSADRIYCTTLDEGTGDLELETSAFSAKWFMPPAALNGQLVDYAIIHRTQNQVETGSCLYDHPTLTLLRALGTASRSSAGEGVKVAFSPGVKDVIFGFGAATINAALAKLGTLGQVLPALPTSGTLTLDFSAIGPRNYPPIIATGAITFAIAANPVNGARLRLRLQPHSGGVSLPFASFVLAGYWTNDHAAFMTWTAGADYTLDLVYDAALGKALVERWPIVSEIEIPTGGVSDSKLSASAQDYLRSPAGVGMRPTLTSAALIEALPAGTVTSIAEKYGISKSLAVVATGSAPVAVQRDAEGWIPLIANGTVSNGKIWRQDDVSLMAGSRWLLTAVMDVDVNADWANGGLLMELYDYVGDTTGAWIYKTGGVVYLEAREADLADSEQIPLPITPGKQIISLYLDNVPTPGTYVVRIQRLDSGVVTEVSGAFGEELGDPDDVAMTLVFGHDFPNGTALGTHRYGGHRLLSGMQSLSANNIRNLMKREAEELARSMDPAGRHQVDDHGSVTVVTDTTGAYDLVLKKGVHNYFVNLVSLTGELTFNLPAATDWRGGEVTIARSGGAQFDLVVNGASRRLRKGEMVSVVSDGVVWQPVENRRGLAQVRETSNAPSLTFETHSGKLAVFTSSTAISASLKDTSPTDTTFWCMVEANAAQRNLTFVPAVGADGDGITIHNPGPFTIPANTPRLFLAFATANSDGAHAIFQVCELGGTSGAPAGATEAVAGGTFDPSLVAINAWETIYNQYNQSGPLAINFSVAGSTIHGGTAVVAFNSDGSPITWEDDFVDGVTGQFADLPASLPVGIQKIIFRFNEVLGEGEVFFSRATAASVTFSPTGGIAATTVQAALAELDSDLTAGLAGKQNAAANLTTWAGKTPPSGAVVGESDGQTLTNKTLTAPTITSPTISGLGRIQAMKGYAVTKGTGYTVAAAEAGQVHALTAAITVTVPAVSTLCPNANDAFVLDLVNESAGNCTIDGPGSTNVTMAAGDIATIIARNGGACRVVKGAGTVIS
jgi:hypothetical protein